MTTPKLEAIARFHAPKPIEGERHHQYLMRLAAAFEAWANTILEGE